MRMILKNKYMKNIVAGIMVACMASFDIALIFKMPSIEYEDHDMETYLADGNYSGKDSSFEISNGSDDQISIYEDMHLFNILEIIPAEGLGTIGYSLDGFEPLPVDGAEAKHAMMDALGNTVTGVDWTQPSGTMNNVITQFSDGEKKPFDFTKGKYTGYYKYVGKGNGYYSIYNNSLDRANHTVQMISKFYNNGSGRDNDYIWIDTAQSFDDLLKSDSVDSDNDIVVRNHWKYKYKNFDIFYNSFYNPESYDSSSGEYSSSSVEDWKKTHKIQLRTKISPKPDGNVSNPERYLDDADLEWADFIVLTDGRGVNGQSAYTLYKQACPDRSFPDLNNIGKPELKTFEQVLKIYDRVVAKEDVAIMVDADQNLTGGNVDTNLKKLVAMLFLVNNTTINGGVGGTGRRVFMDYIQDYVDSGEAPSLSPSACSNRYNGLQEPNGYMFQDFPRDKVNYQTNDPGSCYFDKNGQKVRKSAYFTQNKSNTTDYIYIDKSTGKFIVDKKNQDRYFYVDYDNEARSFVHRYASWNNLYNSWNNSDKWPWDIDNEGCLKQWWFGDGVTDQGCHLPLYYHYYAWDNMRAIKNPAYATFKNQSYSQHNSIFKGNAIKDIIDSREVKREYEDSTHVEPGTRETTKYFYLSVNIENGDGVNITKKGNKVMYINDYEIDEGITNSLPINFVVRSSENISKIEILKKTGSSDPVPLSPAITYNHPTPDTNDITDVSSTNTLTFNGPSTLTLRSMMNDTEPTPDSEHHNLLIYKYEGSTGVDLKKDPYFKTGSNNKFILRVWVQPVEGRPGKYVDDEICVVKRGFFELN